MFTLIWDGLYLWCDLCAFFSLIWFFFFVLLSSDSIPFISFSTLPYMIGAVLFRAAAVNYQLAEWYMLCIAINGQMSIFVSTQHRSKQFVCACACGFVGAQAIRRIYRWLSVCTNVLFCMKSVFILSVYHSSLFLLLLLLLSLNGIWLRFSFHFSFFFFLSFSNKKGLKIQCIVFVCCSRDYTRCVFCLLYLKIQSIFFYILTFCTLNQFSGCFLLHVRLSVQSIYYNANAQLNFALILLTVLYHVNA